MMTEPRDELEEAVQSVIEKGRRWVGPEPSEEELLAYHRRELSPSEMDRFEERLAHYPDAARLLAAFTTDAEPKPGDPDHVSDEGQATAWRELQARLDEPMPPARAAHSFSPSAPKPATFWRRIPVPARIAFAATTGLVLLLGILWYGRGERIEELSRQVALLREPQINPEQRLFAPEMHHRGAEDEGVIQLPHREHPYLISFALFDVPDYPSYRLVIVRAGSASAEPIWTSSGLERQSDGTFSLLIPGTYLPRGKYELRLFGLRGKSAELLASYVVEV